VVHCIDESLLGQLRGKGAAALVAAVFLDEVFLVQLRIFRGHDRQRDSVRLSGRRVDDPGTGCSTSGAEGRGAIPELWFSWPSIEGLPELDA
jgi:hypothetical protein